MKQIHADDASHEIYLATENKNVFWHLQKIDRATEDSIPKLETPRFAESFMKRVCDREEEESDVKISSKTVLP